MNPIYYTVFCKKTVFIPLKSLFPECSVLIAEHSQIENLQCLIDTCPANANCMASLVPRVNALFEENSEFEMIVAYFKHRSSSRIRAGIFTNDLAEPYVKTCNPSALRKFQREGITYQWFPNESFFKKSSDLIFPESLIR